MTTSQKTSLLSEIEAGLPIPAEKRAYFQARLQHRLYDYVVSKFQQKAKSEGLTKANLARRIGRKPEIITRLLGSPGNWRLETVSDLLLGISAEELDMSSTSLLGRIPRNFTQLNWNATPKQDLTQSASNQLLGEPQRLHGTRHNDGKKDYADMLGARR